MSELNGEKKPDATAKADDASPPEKSGEKSTEKSAPKKSDAKVDDSKPGSKSDAKESEKSKDEAGAHETIRRLRELPRRIAPSRALAA